MNHVSAETARKLKDAGFPMPETVAPGSAWYPPGGSVKIFGSTVEAPAETLAYVKAHDWAYAPSPADILRNSPDEWALLLRFEDGYFQAGTYDDWGEWCLWAGHEDAAEACALAWLKEKQRK